MNTRKHNISVRLTEYEYRAMIKYCSDRNLKYSDLIRTLINNYLNQEVK